MRFITIGYGFVIAGLMIMVCVLAGYLSIIYVMFGGTKRLEMRQNRIYGDDGDDPECQKYVRTTHIMIPFIPLYCVKKYKWFVA